MDNKKHWKEWNVEEREDVAEVIQETVRDDTGISYSVSVALRSFAASAYEVGEDRLNLWTERVEFGTTTANCSGGAWFVQAARKQAAIAAEISAVVWSWDSTTGY